MILQMQIKASTTEATEKGIFDVNALTTGDTGNTGQGMSIANS